MTEIRSLRRDIEPYVRALWKLHDEGINLPNGLTSDVLRTLIRDLEWQAVTVDKLVTVYKKRTGRHSREAERIKRVRLDSDTYDTCEHLHCVGTDEGSHKWPDVWEQARGDLGVPTETVKKAYFRFKKALARADLKLSPQDWGAQASDLTPLDRVLAADRLFPRRPTKKPTS